MPKMNPKLSLLPLVVLLLALVCPPASADEIKLKSGEVIKGTILYESEEMVRIEVPVTPSIKETKMISRADIESIEKTAPDQVEYEKIAKLVPTGSLINAESYRQMIETGPDSFLRNHADSQYAEKVKEIRDTLADELDKVERGFIKIEEDWISPQERTDFKDLVDSRVRFLRMQNYAKSDNLGSLIGAMREFEKIEKDYLGAPVTARAVALAKEIIPRLGRQLQTLAANIDYQTAEFERSLAASTPEAQASIKAAREREDKNYAAAVEKDKKDGVRWVQLNPRSKPAIEEYIKMASSELARLRTYDIAALERQGEVLLEADKFIASNRLAEANNRITSAAAMSLFVQPGDGKGASKAPAPRSMAGGKGSGYLGSLKTRVDARLAEEKAREQAQQQAARSQSLAANLKKSEQSKKGEEAEEGEKKEGEEAEKEVEVDDFTALGAARKAKAAEGDGTPAGAAPAAKSKASARPAPAPAPGGDDAPPPPPPVMDDEGGFPTWLIGPILTALVVIAIVVLKVLGIGTGKREEE